MGSWSRYEPIWRLGRALSVENGGGGQTAPKSLISIIRLHQSATKPDR
ncbi:MAG: hypothetical protein Ct9H90mP30_2400 [Actinomycetota bacterium]|nr:MAG: hypothetical protein Ct9H90mP30_2400 [Actinomycetota bacterium]